MWSAMALIALLFFLSVCGAFLGAQRAKAFFNSIPLVLYWLAFIVLLIVGIGLFRRLLLVPALLLIHIGCVLILVGALWSSAGGHILRQKIFGIKKIPSGYMKIYEGYSNNQVELADGTKSELPFAVGLKDFRIDHYEPDYLLVQSRRGDAWIMPVEIGAEYFLNTQYGTIKILRAFENFKINIGDENRVAIDDLGPGYKPAIEVRINSPNKPVTTRYVFEDSQGHMHIGDELLLRLQRAISEYTSELKIIRDGKIIVEKDIQVNHPLHYGGYHFYQQDYDHQAGLYTVLEVTSDSGLISVYAGYLMLCIGLCWHFWINKLFRKGTSSLKTASKSE
ncbi:MAG: cytochrome c biogenesis protein ResB [Sedimentisphaerales bacterium]|nr:cytochrome c biogenesis protein ResB [Sedimentisphaerales bacterium]